MEEKHLLDMLAATLRDHDPTLGYAILLFHRDGTRMATNCTEDSAKVRLAEVLAQKPYSSEERKVGAG